MGPAADTWNSIAMRFPRLGFFGAALHCSPMEFLEILTDYRSALIDSFDIGDMHICSVFELVFRSWAEHNSFTPETIFSFLRLGLHRQFLPNQWLLAAFDSLHTQAKSVILPIALSNQNRARQYMLAFVQSFRNLHCKPGILSPVDTSKIVTDQDGSQLAPFDSSLESRCLVDLSLSKPVSLLKERIKKATLSFSNRSSNIPSPTFLENILNKWPGNTFSDAISKIIQGSSSPQRSLKRVEPSSSQRTSPARVSFSENASANNSESEEGGLGSFRVISTLKNATSSPPALRSQPSEAHRSGLKRDGDRTQPSPRSSPASADHSFWLSHKLPSILDSISPDLNHSARKIYEKNINARISKGYNPRSVINISWLKEGYDIIPLYRLFPSAPRIFPYCCVCGARSAQGSSHSSDNCPYRTGSPQSDFPALNAPPGQRSDHPPGQKRDHM